MWLSWLSFDAFCRGCWRHQESLLSAALTYLEHQLFPVSNTSIWAGICESVRWFCSRQQWGKRHPCFWIKGAFSIPPSSYVQTPPYFLLSCTCVSSWKDKFLLAAHFSLVVPSRFTFHLLDLCSTPFTASAHLCQQDGAHRAFSIKDGLLLHCGLSLPIHRSPKEARKWYVLSQVIWTGPHLALMLFLVHTPAPAGWCFCNHSTAFGQNWWTSVSLASLLEIVIKKMLSVLRFTIYIFCNVSAVG